MPSPSVALLVKRFLGLKHPVAEAAGVSSEGDPRLDRSHAASAQLAVAFSEGPAVLGESPGDPHQRVASLAGSLAGDRPCFADRRRFIACWCQAGEGVEALSSGEALDWQGVDGERGSPGRRDSRQTSSTPDLASRSKAPRSGPQRRERQPPGPASASRRDPGARRAARRRRAAPGSRASAQTNRQRWRVRADLGLLRSASGERALCRQSRPRRPARPGRSGSQGRVPARG